MRFLQQQVSSIVRKFLKKRKRRHGAQSPVRSLIPLERDAIRQGHCCSRARCLWIRYSFAVIHGTHTIVARTDR